MFFPHFRTGLISFHPLTPYLNPSFLDCSYFIYTDKKGYINKNLSQFRFPILNALMVKYFGQDELQSDNIHQWQCEEID